MRDTLMMLKRKKRKEKMLPLLGIEPTPLYSNVVVLAYLNNFQSGGNALRTVTLNKGIIN
jgi:hypothetical protein